MYEMLLDVENMQLKMKMIPTTVTPEYLGQ